MKNFYIILLITSITLLVRPNECLAQTGDQFVSNINTSSYGMIVNDIAYANKNNEDKVFVYSLKKLLVFNGSEESNKTVVNFGGNNEEYGQYQFAFNAFEDLPVHTMMTVDNGHFLYVVTPKLNIIRVNTLTSQKDPNFLIQNPTGTTMAGDNIIRFDAAHNRLFWTYRIKDQSGFHLGVYQINTDNSITLINDFNDYYSASDPAYQIFDIAFNATNNIFYLSRNGSYEVWEIVGNSLILRKTISIGIYDRTGKLIYVNQQGFHKVFCLPFGTDYAPATVYVIDGDNYNQYTQFSVPYRKVRSGIFDASNNNLILGFLMDGEGNPNYDIAVYHYQNNNYNLQQTITTGTTATDNSPLFFLKRSNDFIVSKNDEIIRLSYSENPAAPYYSQSLITAKTNFFNRSVATADNHAYVTKMVSSGVEAVNPDNTIGNEIITGSITYKGVFDNISQKAYIFSRQHYDKSHITVVNTNTNNVSTITTGKAVGDVVFNPYNNEFIVIENKNEPTSFKVYNGVTNTLTGEHTTGMANCEKMFIDPNNHLYITGNMLPNNGNIKIKIYDATTYNLIDSVSFNYNSSNPDGYVKADFDYNYHNKCVYGVFRTFYAGFSPAVQTPENNSDGALIKITSDLTITTFSTGMNKPSKIICDNSESVIAGYDAPGYPGYQGVCYIRMAGNTVVVFDCLNETVTTVGPYSDITYSPYTDVAYGITGVSSGTIRSIDKNGTQSEIYSSTNIPRCSSINYNKHNGRLYLYVVKDPNTLHTMLYSIDPLDVPAGLQSTYLHNRSVDVVGNNDEYFPNDLVVDPVSNRIFIPNGTHGNISVVSFVANEPLYLHAGWDWISFPRLIRDVNDPDYPDASYLAVTALTHRIMPEDYFSFDKNQMVNLPPNTPIGNEVYIDWKVSSQSWIPKPNYELSYVKSTRGEKILIGPANSDHYLFFYGTILDATQPVNLYAGNDKENWVGYFLPETQDPLDALSNIFPYLKSIQAEKWAGYNAGTEAKPDWIMSKPTPLRYGDMLILKTYQNIAFTWHRAGNPFGTNDAIAQATHYSYTTTADYTSFFIAYDTLNPPLEIGAYVNDTCVGACAVNSSDTLAFIQGYLQGNSGDSVVFENYYGTKSTEKTRIRSYYVESQGETQMRKRAIKIGENKDFYLVSFQKPKQHVLQTPDILFSIQPNPVSEKLNITYNIPVKSNIKLSVYNMQGQQLAVILQGVRDKGNYSFMWDLKYINGLKLKKGIYLLQFSTGSASSVKKVIVN